MPRTFGRTKWYAGTACVLAAAAVSGGVAIAAQSGPSHSSGPKGAGPGTVSGLSGQFVPANGSAPPAAPAGSTAYSSKASGSGKALESHRASPRASVRHGAEVSGPSYSSGPKGSGPGTVSGPDGQFVQANGSAPPAAPAGSTAYGSSASGSGKVVKSYSVPGS
jgi:hypothetical protein